MTPQEALAALSMYYKSGQQFDLLEVCKASEDATTTIFKDFKLLSSFDMPTVKQVFDHYHCKNPGIPEAGDEKIKARKLKELEIAFCSLACEQEKWVCAVYAEDASASPASSAAAEQSDDLSAARVAIESGHLEYAKYLQAKTTDRRFTLKLFTEDAARDLRQALLRAIRSDPEAEKILLNSSVILLHLCRRYGFDKIKGMVEASKNLTDAEKEQVNSLLSNPTVNRTQKSACASATHVGLHGFLRVRPDSDRQSGAASPRLT